MSFALFQTISLIFYFVFNHFNDKSTCNQSLQAQINKIRTKKSLIDETLRSYCDHSVKKGNKLNRSGLHDSKKDRIKNVL